MKTLVKISAAFLALALSPMVHAKAVEEKNLASGKATIKSDMGYIFVSASTRQNGLFIKIPDDQDIEEYKADWEESFLKARKKYEKKIARYPREVEFAKKARRKIPPKPVEVTRENFSIGPIEFRNTVSYGPQFVFNKNTKDKNNKVFTYLNEVTPGTYVYYGPLFVNPNGGGYFGTCFCMGSIQFDVKPGVITNIGNIIEQGIGASSAGLIDHDTSLLKNENATVTLEEVNFALPDSMKEMTSENAVFFASRKYDNQFGVMIDRFPRVSGVLDYQQDKVVDLKAKIDTPKTSDSVDVAAEAPDAAATSDEEQLNQ